MKALKIVIVILVILLGIFLIPPLFMPGELFIEETYEMEAPPEVIWDQVACMENWETWDLWHQDTNMVSFYEGPECGVGSKNTWTYKNTEDGGSQTIVEAKKFEYIKTLLDFQKMGTAESEFFLEKTEAGTKVTWNLKGSGSYPVMRWINTLLIIPGVTEAYQTGLKNLDSLTKDMEINPKYKTGEIGMKEVTAMPAIAINAKVGMDEMEQAMSNAFGEVMMYAQQNSIEIAGPPQTIWYKWEEDDFDFDNVVPVKKKVEVSGKMKMMDTYGGNTVTVTHTGNYNTTQYSWMALDNYIKENDLETNGPPFEVYITNPQAAPDPNKWITELYWPVK